MLTSSIYSRVRPVIAFVLMMALALIDLVGYSTWERPERRAFGVVVGLACTLLLFCTVRDLTWGS